LEKKRNKEKLKSFTKRLLLRKNVNKEKNKLAIFFLENFFLKKVLEGEEAGLCKEEEDPNTREAHNEGMLRSCGD